MTMPEFDINPPWLGKRPPEEEARRFFAKRENPVRGEHRIRISPVGEHKSSIVDWILTELAKREKSLLIDSLLAKMDEVRLPPLEGGSEERRLYQWSDGDSKLYAMRFSADDAYGFFDSENPKSADLVILREFINIGFTVNLPPLPRPRKRRKGAVDHFLFKPSVGGLITSRQERVGDTLLRLLGKETETVIPPWPLVYRWGPGGLEVFFPQDYPGILERELKEQDEQVAIAKRRLQDEKRKRAAIRGKLTRACRDVQREESNK